MTINELVELLNREKVTGRETVCLEVNGNEFVMARGVYKDDGDVIISNTEQE